MRQGTDIYKITFESGLSWASVQMNIRICLNIRIFSSEYWYSYSIHGNFECQILFEYSNILSEYWSLKIRGNAGIKEVLFSFFTWKDTYSTKSKSCDNLILVWIFRNYLMEKYLNFLEKKTKFGQYSVSKE